VTGLYTDGLTVCIKTGEVLPVKFASPPYTAVIECDPTASVDVVNVALPPLSVPVPSTLVPSLNVTDPVGVPVVDDFTVAVKVTGFPCFEGLSEELTVLDVAAFVTVSVSTAEVLPVKFASPPYTAVIECDPTASVDVVNVALPPLSVPVPSTLVPSLKVTIPVGVPEVAGLTVAVKVTAWPNTDGFAEETTDVEVAALFTVNVAAFDVLFEEELKTVTWEVPAAAMSLDGTVAVI
jgi:hypothetical protein